MRISWYQLRLEIALIVVSLVPNQAFAWGSEGHRIIAEIAEQYLEPNTAHQIRDLLAIEKRRGYLGLGETPPDGVAQRQFGARRLAAEPAVDFWTQSDC